MKTARTSRIAFLNSRLLIGFALYGAGLVLAFGSISRAVAGDNALGELSSSIPAQALRGTWTATGDLGTPRDRQTATLLPNGQVLVAGGIGSTYLASAELYDPATGVWTATSSMTTARGIHTATLLPNGQVLVAGGFNGTDFLASSELYDPTTGVWMGTGSMATARSDQTATLLPTGQVLVAGGIGDGDVSLTSVELYQSATGAFDIQ
jgi:hypothetical protein